jgi:DNA-binding NarL/FixJ family response regulator
MPRVRILLADDHEAMLARVRSELEEEFEVVAVVRNGLEALEAVASLDPDVLVIDISMPVMDGLQTANKLRASKSRVKVVFLTIHDDPDFFEAAFRAGALAYVTKERVPRDLVQAVRRVVAGHSFISPH